jgi:ABC-2 type transport system permease protein
VKTKKPLLIVKVFSKINIVTAFRDKVALFFIFLFPLIFLFVFGGIFGRDSGVSFKIALLNQSDSSFSKQFVEQAKKNKLFKIDEKVTNMEDAREKMSRGQLDAAVTLPEGFGDTKNNQYPSGEAIVSFNQNDEQAGQALTSVLQSQFQEINRKFVAVQTPFTAKAERLNTKGLSQFDYVFAGLLGFSIIGLGIFGPVNVFPQLKKQGVLRRLHTTPIRVWEYFVSNVASQSVIGMLSIGIQFVVAITVFNLTITGNIITLVPFLILSIITILGIGLAIGGWAKNEQQAAPLANIIVFPMLFLSGTFFPRFLMPEWLQNVSNFLPLTPVIDGIRLIATEGKTLVDLGPQIGLLAAWMVVIYVIAFRVFRWE